MRKTHFSAGRQQRKSCASTTRLRRGSPKPCFGGEYNEAFDAGRSGVFEGGVVKIHLRRWPEDQDAWTLARYLCSPVMQREAGRLYRGLRLDQLNSASLISEPDQALRCGFPFEGPTTVRGIFLSLQGPTPSHILVRFTSTRSTDWMFSIRVSKRAF